MEQECSKDYSVQYAPDNQNSHMPWNNNEVSSLEREMLLGNLNYSNSSAMSNWAKVVLTSITVLIPGLGQAVGLVTGMILAVNEEDKGKRSFGAALITVSIFTFFVMAVLWLKFVLHKM